MVAKAQVLEGEPPRSSERRQPLPNPRHSAVPDVAGVVSSHRFDEAGIERVSGSGPEGAP